MTLYELQQILGNQIEKVTDESLSKNERAEVTGIAQSVACLAKQMINNADVVLRTERLVIDGKLNNSIIQRMVGGEDGEVLDKDTRSQMDGSGQSVAD